MNKIKTNIGIKMKSNMEIKIKKTRSEYGK